MKLFSGIRYPMKIQIGLLIMELADQGMVYGVDYITIHTERTNEEQAFLYRAGRTIKQIKYKASRLRRAGHEFLAEILLAAEPNRRKTKVTNAGPGESSHNIKEGWDIALLVDGKVSWKSNDPRWALFGKVAKEMGLIWGGEWKAKDLGHVQLRTGNPLTY